MNETKISDNQSNQTVLIDRDGTTRYLNEFGKLHREGDLPALIQENGATSYYKNGLLHRDNDKPAKISPDEESYYHYGLRHREKGPAIINFFIGEDKKRIFSQEYFKDGKLHREDGPAILWDNGSYLYYKNGELHNENGPASHCITPDGIKDQYYLNEKPVSKLLHTIYKMRANLFVSNNSKKRQNI